MRVSQIWIYPLSLKCRNSRQRQHTLPLPRSENNFDEVFSVNVKGLFIALQQEIRQMLRQGFGGSNMASVGGSLATAGASVYVASKHAVLGLTKSAAIEYGSCGIRDDSSYYSGQSLVLDGGLTAQRPLPRRAAMPLDTVCTASSE